VTGQETIGRQSLPRTELSTVRVVIYRYRRPSRNSPAIVLPERKSSVVFGDILISLQRGIQLHRDARIGDWGENKTGGDRRETGREWEGESKRRVADGERKASAVRRVDYRFCLPGGPSSSIDIRNPAEPVVELMQKSMNQ